MIWYVRKNDNWTWWRYYKKVTIIGGCAGNTLGLSNLIQGMNIDEAIKRLKGVPCGMRGTSCPDQLAIALQEAKNSKKNLY